MGMVTGTISGLGASVQYAGKNQVDLLTGKDKGNNIYSKRTEFWQIRDGY